MPGYVLENQKKITLKNYPNTVENPITFKITRTATLNLKRNTYLKKFSCQNSKEIAPKAPNPDHRKSKILKRTNLRLEKTLT